MGIYCKSISPGTETVHSSTKKILTEFVTFRYVDLQVHIPRVWNSSFFNKKSLPNLLPSDM